MLDTDLISAFDQKKNIDRNTNFQVLTYKNILAVALYSLMQFFYLSDVTSFTVAISVHLSWARAVNRPLISRCDDIMQTVPFLRRYGWKEWCSKDRFPGEMHNFNK